MKKILGILGLFVAVFAITAIINPKFISANNMENLLSWTGLFGMLGVGAAFVIITGGIDLSIGSVVGLVGCLIPLLIVDLEVPPHVAIQLVLWISAGIGLLHGLLITKLNLQPFVVTLCGLLVYRGIARWITGDSTMSLGDSYDGLRLMSTGNIAIPFFSEWTKFEIPIPFFVLVLLTIAGAILLDRTVVGRYMLALGRNEQAARYSGIKTQNQKILAYMICSTLAGFRRRLFHAGPEFDSAVRTRKLLRAVRHRGCGAGRVLAAWR